MDAGLEIKDGTKADITVTRPRWPVQTPMIKAALESSSSGVMVPASGQAMNVLKTTGKQ